eukprot:c4346_g1_i1.p1 GENE.c4346_g1_i1~~c4346_g1_i1.p1  ORF type:complete len:113 (-),score=28.52 c4346_g1_i1:156-494(-)
MQKTKPVSQTKFTSSADLLRRHLETSTAKKPESAQKHRKRIRRALTSKVEKTKRDITSQKQIVASNLNAIKKLDFAQPDLKPEMVYGSTAACHKAIRKLHRKRQKKQNKHKN